MQKRVASSVLIICLAWGLGSVAADDGRPEIVVADFEASSYGDWIVVDEAFGTGPAKGTLPAQMEVLGFKGKRLVNSFHGGDDTMGTLTSPPFTIERKSIAFLVGGGGFEGKTCVNLLVNDKVVRTATGQNTKPGGSEFLVDARWDVSGLEGKTARIQIVDQAKGSWGHILVDQIVLTDNPEVTLQVKTTRDIMVQQKRLVFPVKNGATMRKVTVRVDGEAVREFNIEAADDTPDWWASLDLEKWRGKTLKVEVDRLPEGSKFLTTIEQSDTPKGSENLYSEALRPQFHFSPARGWNNDPNGLVYYKGEYHLFFQFNPYGTRWENMHWGHAVSKDLMHWTEKEIALYPDAMGMMFSGSAVVDSKNTSGLGSNDKAPLVLIYTAAGAWVQCLASSSDGRTFAKYPRNPVVRTISNGNRNPKVIWHEPTKKWVMVLYVHVNTPPKQGESKPIERETIQFLTSPDLKDWTIAGRIDGLFECPDLFPLAVDGDPIRTKWVLTAANGEYMLGRFDGETFAPETSKLAGHVGRGFYAAQTFSDMPEGDRRRIMVGWFQTPSPGMPFNQSMTVPLELKLLSTPEGPRLSYTPARELEILRTGTKRIDSTELEPGGKPLSDPGADLLDIRLGFDPSQTSEVQLTVHGASIRYDARNQKLIVNDLSVPAALRSGKQKLIVLVDRNSLEVFASDGLIYVPFPFIPQNGDTSVQVSAKGGPARIDTLEIHTLKSAWRP